VFIKRLVKYIIVPLLLIVVGWVGYFLVYGNFHKVDDDLYRSAQLFEFNMPYYLQKYHIKSVVNLRGSSKKEWYQDEIRISKESQVVHYDFGIGDRERISYETMESLVNLMRKAPKPILIHCKAGADRTSLASALYLYAIKHDRNAQEAISIFYGHFPWLGSKTKAMDESFRAYKREHVKGLSDAKTVQQ